MSDSPGSEKLLQVLEALSASGAEVSTNSEKRFPVRDGDVQGSEHNVPLDPPTARGYLPELYSAERDIGLRRDSGANKLKKLKPRHKKVLALHLAGWPSHEIAAEVDMTVSWVSTVISDPLSQAVINNFEDLQEEEFKRLRVLANDALRTALQPDMPIKTRLEGAREFHRREVGLSKDNKGVTAEDIMSRILANIRDNENVQVNFNMALNNAE